MDSFRSILVDIDAAVPAHPALDRAVRLARASGASLTIVDVLAVPAYAQRYLPAGVQEDMVGRRRQQIERITRSIAGVRVEARLLTGRPATALIQEVLRSGHDLLLRSHGRGAEASGFKPFGAVDMELLRKCPCPVFLVRHGSLETRPRIVAAVNCSTEDESERSLNTRIVETALQVSELEGGEPMLLQAWAPFAESMVRSHSPDDAFTAYVADVRQRSEADVRHLAQSFGNRLAGTQIVLRRGEPEEVIPDFVVAEGIDLVVMGTVARGGIAGLLIGNTAERVLRTLPCSVLAVKPEGFVSPVVLGNE